MESFIYSAVELIPKEYREDVDNLREYIMKEMKVGISKKDTYLLWIKVSNEHNTEFLDIQYVPERMTREQFIRDQMKTYGMILRS